MIERFAIFLLSLYSVLSFAGTSVEIIAAGQPVATEKIATDIKAQQDKALLSAYKLPETTPLEKKADALAFGDEVTKKLNDNAADMGVLPDLFNSNLQPSFSVQGRFIEKENMSKEGSEIEGAAVKFIFVQ